MSTLLLLQQWWWWWCEMSTLFVFKSLLCTKIIKSVNYRVESQQDSPQYPPLLSRDPIRPQIRPSRCVNNRFCFSSQFMNCDSLIES